jgi:hypothetical protein
MKKVMMNVALILAIAIAAGYSMIGSDKSEMNVADLTSANLEALGQALPPVCSCANGGTYCDCPDHFSWGKTAKYVEPNE